MSDFSVRSVVDADQVTLVVSGEIDMAARGNLIGDAERCLISPDCQRVVLDLGGVGFIDSSGLAALVTIHHQAEAAGKRLALCRVPDLVGRLLTLTALDTLLTVSTADDPTGESLSPPFGQNDQQPASIHSRPPGGDLSS